ncbi:hypothetical protein [Nitrospirillum iridis]|uniref:Uncharacterized protein n=1 Tax=Nitrospirillum iridis TaxID=765888 RepID=A0A7X0AUI5_9PROT|nr:hypothetical protein [Nitrospirillum iridis]MBB6250372.1 hypothetical protein [Nitrospirillum iridis]
MTTQVRIPFAAEGLVSRLAPLLVIGLAALVIRTPWAEAHPRLAVALFLWITVDSLTTALVLRHRRMRGRPGVRLVLATIAVGLVSAAAGLTPPLRAALWSMPWAVAGVAALVGGHVLWGLAGAWTVWRRPGEGEGRLEAAVACLVPPPFAPLVARELSVLHLALFCWRAAPDVPTGCQPFSYHRDLTPVMGGLLVAQVMEIVVLDVALGIHHRMVALALFVLGDLSFIYLLGLTKSLRLRPVLLTPHGVRVRFGPLVDRLVPYDAIGGVGVAADMPQRGPENHSPLLAPNVALTLVAPVRRRRFLRRARSISTVAFAVDDPQAFIRALQGRLSDGREQESP